MTPGHQPVEEKDQDKTFLGDRNILYLAMDGDYINVYNNQNLLY
jgi:hypothetical protein